MEWTKVQSWIAEGSLPTLSRLQDEGAWGQLKSTATQFPDTVWLAVATGKNPAKLPKYFPVQYDAQKGKLRYISDDEIDFHAFWHDLASHGAKVGLADIPDVKYSPRYLFQVVDWGVHASKGPFRAFPAGLDTEILRRFGRHPVGHCDQAGQNDRALLDLRARILKGIHAHGELFRWLLSSQSWDFFFGTFSAPHCGGHRLWHCDDNTHRRFTGKPDSLNGTIKDIYQAIDKEIGLIIDAFGDETYILITAPHGMGPLYHASWRLQTVLDLLGYGTASHQGVNPWLVLKNALPSPMQYWIKERLPRRWQEELIARQYTSGLKMKGTRAFAVPNNDAVGAIRVNLKGRDPYGVVEPGRDYDDLCRKLVSDLAALSDPVTAKPVVANITISKESFSGPNLQQLPDITASWEQSFPWCELHSPKFGILRLKALDYRTGSHSDHGFFILQGPDIRRGEYRGHSIYDIAPTLLDLAGVKVSSDIDGQCIPLFVRAQSGKEKVAEL